MKKSVVGKIFTLIFSMGFIKLLGFVFRVYLSKVSGAEGCGLYHLVLSVYSLGASISSFGISQTLTRLVALNEKHSKRILRTALIFTGAVSFIVSLIVFLKSEYIALFILKDSRVVKSLKAIAFSFPMIAVFSCVGGYFNGLIKVKYVAKGQLIEQITRILFVFIFAKPALENGMENGIFVMSLGIVLGEYISAIYIWFSYRIFAKTKGEGYIKKSFLCDILKISFPIALGGYISSFLHTLENILLPQKLASFGLTVKEGVSALGALKGMAAPILFFPALIISSISVIALPEISKAQGRAMRERIKSLSERVLAASVIVGVLSSLFTLCNSKSIARIIYGNIDAATPLFAMSFSLPFLYFNMSAVCVLNGLGKQVFTTVESVCTGILKILFIVFLVPLLGMNGYYLGFFLSETVGFIINFILIFNTIIAKKAKKL